MVTRKATISSTTPKGNISVKRCCKKRKIQNHAKSPRMTLQSILEGHRSCLGTSPPGAFSELPPKEYMEAYQKDILAAVSSKNLSRLKELHSAGRNLNACNRFGESLLHMACRRGNVDIISFMVREANVQTTICDDYGRTPFHDACWTPTPNFPAMDILLETADPSMLLCEDVRGNTPLEYARKEHQEAWVGYLKSRTNLIQKRMIAVQRRYQQSTHLRMSSDLFKTGGGTDEE